MAGQKESPRQKMIGMMYLVLTALLALNVSKDILNAFVLVNDGMEQTVENFEQKNQDLYDAFALKNADNAAKFGASYTKALEAKKLSDELASYIEELKVQLIMETEGIPREVADTINLAWVNGKDNYDIPTLLMIGESEDGSGGKSAELRKKVEQFKTDLLAMLDEQDREMLNVGLELEGGVENGTHYNWEMKNFYHTQLAPTIVILSKLQNDIRNAEYDVVSKLFGENNKRDFPIDTIAARVIAPTSYVMLGDEYKAEVIVAGFSTSKNPEVILGELDAEGKLVQFQDSLSVRNGVGQYSVQTNKEGLFEYSGLIKVKNNMGEETSYPFTSSYMVARPSATVSATKMNVLYKGIDNPISVSVPGVADEDVRVSITSGSLRRTGQGMYEAKLGSGTPRTVKVRVSAVLKNGETKPMGEMEYRVKNLPKPYSATNNNLHGAEKVKKSKLTIARSVVCTYGTGFVFDLKAPKVLSYKIGFQKGVQPIPEKLIRGHKIPDDYLKVIKKLSRGDKVFFTEIKIKDAGGVTHILDPIMITIK